MAPYKATVSPPPSSSDRIGSDDRVHVIMTHADSQQRVKVPAWRRQLRSRVFRTTLLVVIVHVVCWLPYNLFALSLYVNKDLFENLSDLANICKSLQVSHSPSQ